MKQILLIMSVSFSLLGFGQHVTNSNPFKFRKLTFGSLPEEWSLLYRPSYISAGCPAVLPHKVEHPAFFCRMELKAVEHAHVWIKVHAGDYDSYTRKNPEYTK